MQKDPIGINRKLPRTSKRLMVSATDNMLSHLAFDNAVQANIISTVSSGKIIMTNYAACKLLGYSKKELLTKDRAAIFDINESRFKKMLARRTAKGHPVTLVTAIKKNGKPLSCEITSAVFRDGDGIEKAIISIVDMSQSNLEQKNSETVKEGTIADNIISAQERSGARLAGEIRLKEKLIAKVTKDMGSMARSGIGKELHDNITQLLNVSRMYLEMAKRDGIHRKMFLNRCSWSIFTAIEQSRKLNPVLTTDIIKDLGLCETIKNLSGDIMRTNSIKISCHLDRFKEDSVHHKFKQNIYRLIQEHLDNIVKHAKATAVTISFLQNKKFIILSISDNGVGFDTGKKLKGTGINNIKSRSAYFSGTADFASQPGQGCVLTVTFPFTELLNK